MLPVKFGALAAASWVIWFLSARQSVVSPRYVSDLPGHIALTKYLMSGAGRISHAGLQLLLAMVHLVTGASLETAAGIVLTTAFALTAIVMYQLLARSSGTRGHGFWPLFLTGVLLTVSAIYLPFFNRNVYLGQGSPNIWHNPTFLASRPWALLAVWSLTAAAAAESRKVGAALLAGSSFALLVGAALKPSFAVVFIPAVYLYLLITRRWRYLIPTSLALLPTMILLMIQFLTAYAAGPAPATLSTEAGRLYLNDRIQFGFLAVWRRYTTNVPVSIALALAFPASVLIFRFRQAVRRPALVLAWLSTAIGIAQFAMLAEVSRMNQGNFGWGYYLAMHVLFVFSAVEYTVWLSGWRQERVRGRLGIIASSVILLLHFSSGVYYLARVLSGLSYR
jgi:hypothetical protein